MEQEGDKFNSMYIKNVQFFCNKNAFVIKGQGGVKLHS